MSKSELLYLRYKIAHSHNKSITNDVDIVIELEFQNETNRSCIKYEKGLVCTIRIIPNFSISGM